MSPFTSADTYNVANVEIINNTGNSYWYSGQQLAALGLATSFTVTAGTEPPEPCAYITSNGGGDTAAAAIAENTTAITAVTATDPDAEQTLNYSISGGADAAKFTIDPATGRSRSSRRRTLKCRPTRAATISTT